MSALAEEEKKEEVVITKPILGDPTDPCSEEEEKLCHSLISMALGLDDRLTWTTSSSTDKLLSIQYAYASEGGDTDSAIVTVRGTTTIEDFNPKDFYDFCENSTDEEYNFYFSNDAMCEEATVVKRYSKDRCLVHSRFNAGVSSYIISYRDLCYIKRRLYFENFKISQLPDGTAVKKPETYSQVCLGLVYSIGEDHPDYFAEDKGHVRGDCKYGGYCFFKKNPEDTSCQFMYIVKVDPKGMLPTWVVNLAAPGQARVCTLVRENIDTVRSILAKRRAEEEAAKPTTADDSSVIADATKDKTPEAET